MRTPEAVRMTEKQRAAFAPTPPFDAKEFSAKLVAFCETHPDLKERALANAALRVRFEAQKPENQAKRIPLFALAAKLDEMSAEERMPPVDWLLNQINVTPMDAFDMAHMDVAASKIGPDGVPNSDLVAAFLQQKNLQERENGTTVGAGIGTPAIQQARINPPSAIPGLTMFGNQALVQFGPQAAQGPVGTTGFAATGIAALQEAQVCRWDGQEQDCTVVTVSLSRIKQGAGATYPATATPGGANYGYRPFAHILWGTSRAQPNEIYCDIGLGLQLAIACSFLYVNVGMDDSINSPIWGANGSMVLAGQIAFNGTGRTTPVTRTHYIDSLTVNSTSSTRLVPDFARELLPIQVSERNTGACLIAWSDVAGNVIMRSELFTPGSQVAPIPIPNDAYSYTLQNTGQATAFYRLMFSLSL